MNTESRLLLALLLAVAAQTSSLHAQITEYSRELDAFTRIEVSGDFRIEISEQPGYSVSVSVDDALRNYVQTYVDGGVLKIYLDDKKLTPDIRRRYRSRTAAEPVLRASVGMPSSLRSLTLGDKAVLGGVSGEVFASDSAKFFLSGDARIDRLGLKGSECVHVVMDRRASAELSAECGSLSLEMGGSSRIRLDMHCDEASLKLSSNSAGVFDCDSGNVSVIAKGTSRSIFNGGASAVQYELSGSADVNAENLKCVDAKVDMSGFCTLTESASGSLFLVMSNGAKLVYKNSPVFFISSIRNSSVIRYLDESNQEDDGIRRTL